MKTKIIIYTGLILLFVYAGSASAYTEGASNNYFGTDAGGSGGTNNSFFGGYAGDFNIGNYNTFVGYGAGFVNSSGDSNTFIGYLAGYGNTTGYSNTFIGYEAGRSNTIGYRNTFLGDRAGHSNAGNFNTFLGNYAGYSNTWANYNTSIGYRAGYSNTTGSGNVFLGFQAGYSNTTGGGNVFLGHNAGYNETGSSRLYIDNSNTSTPLIYGEFDNDLVEVNGDLYVAGNTYVDSDRSLKRDIQPIDSSLNKILLIEGITYKWKRDGGTSDRRHYGVIAQQVEEVLPEVVQKGDDEIRKVAYMEMIPVLIEAIKEQQDIVEGQNNTISKLKEQNKQISERLAEIEKELKLKDSMAMADIK